MPNEMTVQGRIAGAKGGASADSGSIFAQLDMAGNAFHQGTQDAATAAAALDIGADIGTAGQVIVKHLGIDGASAATTKYVQLSYQSNGSSPICTIAAGDFIKLPKPSATLYLIAEAGATTGVKVQTTALEA